MIETITNINSLINNLVWGWPALILLGFVGVLMTVLTRFFQLGHFGHWMKNTIGAIFGDKQVTQHTKDRSISQFQSLCTALAATVGTGNIVGVAGAIAVGGPGAVFWMWIIAFFGMMTNFSENVLGILYRHKNSKGEWSGGAMYYLRDGLGSKKGFHIIGTALAFLFACFCLLASFGIGNMSQVNSMVSNVHSAFGIPNIAVGIFLFFAVGIVIIGGLKRVAAVTEKIVPFMVILYVVGALIIIFMNVSAVPAVFVSIFKGAFALKSAAGGIVGAGIAQAMKMGMKRGVFSNEAGLGSSVMVHSNSNVKEPVRQGMWGIFEVFADTIIVCTLTAVTLLSSGGVDLETGLLTSEAAEIGSSSLMGYAFGQTFGQAGSAFIAIAILLFAYSTVLGWSHYGSKACEYLFGPDSTLVYRIVFCIIVLAGSVMEAQLAWDISDTFNGLMMIPNLIGVLALSPLVMRCTKNYVDRKIHGKDIKPMLSMFPEIQEEHEKLVREGAE
ncbi:MAG: alanine:cation symporter family protein [Clostridia bacterium]|nr:alanine/glycine:cation symporter family protein [Lachnospiraceae bacterium]NCC00483.1 alanine:cation symporter family protein [Clostridia bacterium]NCD02494.1 alanine:cation symporter family protein [Clostridia bacterium]